mmetsp:Transcript_91493/g.218076  ORF Transcript_91493/g.218076 Transcript_91493/m.218076 type:complete len:319 (-) Transcript_91493:918-1874(-)
MEAQCFRGDVHAQQEVVEVHLNDPLVLQELLPAWRGLIQLESLDSSVLLFTLQVRVGVRHHLLVLLAFPSLHEHLGEEVQSQRLHRAEVVQLVHGQKAAAGGRALTLNLHVFAGHGHVHGVLRRHEGEKQGADVPHDLNDGLEHVIPALAEETLHREQAASAAEVFGVPVLQTHGADFRVRHLRLLGAVDLKELHSGTEARVVLDVVRPLRACGERAVVQRVGPPGGRAGAELPDRRHVGDGHHAVTPGEGCVQAGDHEEQDRQRGHERGGEVGGLCLLVLLRLRLTATAAEGRGGGLAELGGRHRACRAADGETHGV